MATAITEATIDQAAAGTDTLVAAPGVGKHVEVFAYAMTVALAGTAKFVSGSTDVSGTMTTLAGTPIAVAQNYPVFVCGDNEAFKITTTVGKAAGHLSYRIEG